MQRTVVLAFDKFRGSASASELTSVAAEVAAGLGWSASALPMADGGEGSLEVLGGPNRTTTVEDPLGRPVEAGWRLSNSEAFIEMAAASGLKLVGGAEGNDPIMADTTGTGRLIATAVEQGARKIHVLLGGSATTDGGLGALSAMPPAGRFLGVDLIAACDVETRFVDAATVFGPQKGASEAQVKLLTGRLQRLQQDYVDRYGVDVSDLPGAGAAGGLAGGLVAIGGRIESGFEILAEHCRLDEALDAASLVVTGEGFLDDATFEGKVVGGVHRWAQQMDVPAVAIVGQADTETTIPDGLDVRSLAERYGVERSMAETLDLVAAEVEAVLGAFAQ